MKFVVFLFISVFIHVTAINAEEIPAGNAVLGKKIYDSICVHCHKLTDEKSVVGAPGFKDVTKRRTIEWMNQWIKGPEAFAKKDAAAKKLMEGNKMGVIMPTFPEMQDDKLPHRYNVIEFLKTL